MKNWIILMKRRWQLLPVLIDIRVCLRIVFSNIIFFFLFCYDTCFKMDIWKWQLNWIIFLWLQIFFSCGKWIIQTSKEWDVFELSIFMYILEYVSKWQHHEHGNDVSSLLIKYNNIFFCNMIKNRSMVLCIYQLFIISVQGQNIRWSMIL